MAKAGYVWSGSEWENFTGPSPEILPAGTIVMWVSATAPTGWLICDGSLYSTTTYADLYTNLGNSYELGTETSGNSRLPNFQDRFPIGSDYPTKVEKSSAYQTNTIATHLHTFVPSISVATGNTAHNHNLASFNNDHAHNTNTPSTNGGGDHNHPMNAHNPNAGGVSVPRLIGSTDTTFQGHSHNANAPSTNGGGAHNHGLNAWSTNNANVASHAHSTTFSSLNTHNHSITNNPVQTVVPTTTVIPVYRAIYFIIKATNG